VQVKTKELEVGTPVDRWEHLALTSRWFNSIRTASRNIVMFRKYTGSWLQQHANEMRCVTKSNRLIRNCWCRHQAQLC